MKNSSIKLICSVFVAMALNGHVVGSCCELQFTMDDFVDEHPQKPAHYIDDKKMESFQEKLELVKKTHGHQKLLSEIMKSPDDFLYLLSEESKSPKFRTAYDCITGVTVNLKVNDQLIDLYSLINDKLERWNVLNPCLLHSVLQNYLEDMSVSYCAYYEIFKDNLQKVILSKLLHQATPETMKLHLIKRLNSSRENSRPTSEYCQRNPYERCKIYPGWDRVLKVLVSKHESAALEILDAIKKQSELPAVVNVLVNFNALFGVDSKENIEGFLSIDKSVKITILKVLASSHLNAFDAIVENTYYGIIRDMLREDPKFTDAFNELHQHRV